MASMFRLQRAGLRALVGSNGASSGSVSLLSSVATRPNATLCFKRHIVVSVAQIPATNNTTPLLTKDVPARASRKVRRLALKKQRKDASRRTAASSMSVRLGVKTTQLSPFVRKDRQFKTYKPLTPSLRWLRQPLNEHLWKGKPERALTVAKRGSGGRNHHGHITVRSRGGGHKRRIRMIDFYRWEEGEQTVLRIEYDPGRSAHIALIEHTATKKKSYILATDGLREGDSVQSYRTGVPDHLKTGSNDIASQLLDTDPSSPQSTNPPTVSTESSNLIASPTQNSGLDLGIFRTQAIRSGNFLPLHLIPIGTTIHSLTLHPKGPAKLVRSAGTFGQLVAFSGKKGAGDSFAQVRLQSGEVRLVRSDCCAAIGTVSNKDHQHARLGKAGRSRWLGRRPKVRGVAMNACDHPHGGGRGKSKSNMHPVSIWGHLAKGKRTRKPHTKKGNKMVIRERPRRNGKRLGKP